MRSEQFQLHAEIEQRHWWFLGRRQIMRRLVHAILPPSAANPATIVDVGCGTGANLAALVNDYRCVGIDTSDEAIALARGRFPEATFLTGRAPADLGSVVPQARLLMLMDVLEHVADDFALFSELLAAVVPGTFFLLTVPADESLWSAHDESFGHYRRYDRARLERLWAGLPVSTLLLSCFNARLLPLIKMIRGWTRRSGHAAGRAGTDFWIPRRPLNGALQAVLAGEANRLVNVLNGRRGNGYARGSSLIALLRRNTGPIAIRWKPANLPPDHQPRQIAQENTAAVLSEAIGLR
ncbi:MAG: class I SAM-dependent methyltransferase [Thermoguttaceae bacterium]|jgi:SAM-dependent methyltransferase